jgi:hypothetical protein
MQITHLNPGKPKVRNPNGPLHIDSRTGTVTITLSAKECEAIRYALEDANEEADGTPIVPRTAGERATAQAFYKFHGIDQFLTGAGAPYFEES